jgi:hypothetical protein
VEAQDGDWGLETGDWVTVNCQLSTVNYQPMPLEGIANYGKRVFAIHADKFIDAVRG